jgi:Flp pilus assembly protein TadG
VKRNKFFRSEEGQSLVLIAAVMVGLLALAGLAIDGGNLFLQRRNTQNAADAIALAGTRMLANAICSEPGANDAAIAETVERFARLNDIEDVSSVTAAYVSMDEAVMGRVGAGSIPVGATGVKVVIENPVSTYFLGVVDINTVHVSANALAMTAPPLTSGGLRPVGIPLPLMEVLGPGDEFTINFGNCSQPDECIVSYTGGQVQHRGMMNLAYTWNQGEEVSNWPRALDPSGSANVLKEWMENGYPSGAPFYADCVGCTFGDYIHAKPGRNSSVIGEAPVGETILVPIFDNVPHYDDIPAPKPPQASQGGGYYYHIVGFMAFEITGANQGQGTIDGHFVNAVIGSGQVNTTEGTGFGQGQACQTHLQTVNLWR